MVNVDLFRRAKVAAKIAGGIVSLNDEKAADVFAANLKFPRPARGPVAFYALRVSFGPLAVVFCFVACIGLIPLPP